MDSGIFAQCLYQEFSDVTQCPTQLPQKRRENKREENPVVIYFNPMYVIFGSSTTWGRSTMLPKFDTTGVRTNPYHIMTVHFMSLRVLL